MVPQRLKWNHGKNAVIPNNQIVDTLYSNLVYHAFNKSTKCKRNMNKHQIMADEAFSNCDYKLAIHHYSQAIDHAIEGRVYFDKLDTSKFHCDYDFHPAIQTSLKIPHFHLKQIQLIGKRSRCYRKLKKFDKELRDLNLTMNLISNTKYIPKSWIISNPDHHIIHFHCKECQYTQVQNIGDDLRYFVCGRKKKCGRTKKHQKRCPCTSRYGHDNHHWYIVQEPASKKCRHCNQKFLTFADLYKHSTYDGCIIDIWLKSVCGHLLKRRAKLFYRLGNLSMAKLDFIYASRHSKHPNSNAMNMKTSVSGSRLKCESINKYSFDGWINIKPNNASNEDAQFMLNNYTVKSLIPHKGKLYFYGLWDKKQATKHVQFLEIKLYYNDEMNKYDIKTKKLPFPFLFLNPTKHINNVHVEMVKWRNKLVMLKIPIPSIVHSDLDAYVFDLDTYEWEKMDIIDACCISNNFTFGYIDKMTVSIMNDKLYVFVIMSHLIHDDGSAIAILAILDLITRRIRFEQFIIEDELPSNGHIMWCYNKHGKQGSVFIAFGTCSCYYRDDDRDRDHFCISRNHLKGNYLCRYDVATKKWSRETLIGNFPSRRARAGYTMVDDNKLILFGGGLNKQFGAMNDCFEFSNKFKVWRMIHADNVPSSRLAAAMCQLGDLIVLYGGYEITKKDVCMKALNDLWILNIKAMRAKYRKTRRCKYCKARRGECRLYLCRKCKKTRYCSRYCQKRHWLRHRRTCL